ncbi:MAG: MMPL family transporter [Solirubrobacteraceae bacterium]
MALITLLVLVVAGVFGGPAAGLFKAQNAFEDPHSDSARAEQLLKRLTGAEISPGVLVLVAAPPGSPAVSSVARAVSRQPDVAAVAAPTGRRSPLVSIDGSSVVAATLRTGHGSDTGVSQIEAALAGRHDVTLGGGDVAGKQVGEQALTDLGFAEALVLPLLAILAVLIFRGVAALLPLAAGGLSVLGAFVVLRVLNTFLSLSVFALNLVIAVGLGLAVDYSLFLVWRFREELGRGAEVPEALLITMCRTGRTVLFSGLTVAAAMASLTVFPQRFLVSMGLGGAIVALVAAASALLMVPSLLVLLGPRLGKTRPTAEHEGRWYRLASAVMRRPWLVATASAAVLLLVASPTPGVRWSGIDATVLPHSRSARVVQDSLARDFPALHGGQTIAVVASAPPSARRALESYAGRLRGLPGIAAASAPLMVGPHTWYIKLASPDDAISPAGQGAVQAVRRVVAPAPVLVGGPAADFIDLRDSIANTIPLALAILVAVTVFVLWLMTGSVILPFKTLLMNLLTAAAATGIIVFIFQDGRLTGPLAYTSQRGIEETDFLILAAVAFALSTDYGVFLLSRIKEARDAGMDDREAVAVGLERTGRLVTAASLMLAVAIGAFATAKVVFLKGSGRRDRRRCPDRRVHRPSATRPLADGAARTMELVVAGPSDPAPLTLAPRESLSSTTDLVDREASRQSAGSVDSSPRSLRSSRLSRCRCCFPPRVWSSWSLIWAIAIRAFPRVACPWLVGWSA